MSKRAAAGNSLITIPYDNNALPAKQPNSVQVPRTCKTVTAHATKADGGRRGIALLMLNLWHQWVVTTLWPLYRLEGAQVCGRHSLSGRFQRREKSLASIFFKAYSGERAWKPIGGRLQRPHYLSRVDHERKISSRRQRTDIGKYSFVNRTIQHWNQLPAEVLGILPCKPITFKKRVRKVIIELN